MRRRTTRSSRAPLATLLLALVATLWAVPSGAQEPLRHVEGYAIFVHYGHATAWDELWSAMPERVARVRSQLGPDVLTGGEIHIVARINDFFESRGETVRAPRWAQAVALPQRRLIVLRMPDPDPLQTLTHELSHLAVHEAAGGNHVPYWFLEGFAQVQAQQFGLGRSVSIGQAALFGNTLSFDSLDTEFPPHSLSAGLAYTQSFHFVRRLLDEYGASAVREWLDGVKAGQTWRSSFQAAFGVDPAIEFEAWRDSVRVWYGWIPAVVSVTTFWTLVALLAIWARRAVRRRREERLAVLAARERDLYPPDPDDHLF